MTINRYMTLVYSFLTRHWAIAEDQTEYEVIGDRHGRIVSRVVLLDGSSPYFSEYLVERGHREEKLRYRYQYVKEGTEVFRYDNFDRHPGIQAPYHHYHAPNGMVLQVNEAPSLIDVVEQASKLMFVQ